MKNENLIKVLKFMGKNTDNTYVEMLKDRAFDMGNLELLEVAQYIQNYKLGYVSISIDSLSLGGLTKEGKNFLTKDTMWCKLVENWKSNIFKVAVILLGISLVANFVMYFLLK